MNGLTLCELKKTIKRVDSKILLALCFLPAVLCLMMVMRPDVFDISGNRLGAFEFTNYMLIIQNDVFMPLIMTVFIASMSFYQEISKKTIYFYKDIARKNVLNAKYISVYSVYFTFLILYTLVTFIFYFLVLRHHSMATGTLIAYPEPENVVDMLYATVQVILGATFYIHVGICLALRVSTGMSMFGITLFYIFAKMVPNFPFLKFVFPIGYKNLVDIGNHPYLLSMALSIVVYGIYHFALYKINRDYFKNMQFN